MPQAPTTGTATRSGWEGKLRELAERRGVPGAQLGILRAGEDGTAQVEVAAAGVLNAATGREVRPGSVFQIGSISKVWTATVVMMLIDEGRLTLGTRIVDVLPGFRLADQAAAEELTIWHLLTHTNGIDGDIFTDTGRGDDALEKYVDTLATATQNHPVGATWSYSNTGYVILGRVIEAVTGQTWDAAMAERLFTPLGLGSTTTLPEQTILHDPAIGHVTPLPDATPAPVWSLPRSLGPAGLIVSSAEDVLRFAALHLTGGKTLDGTQVVSAESVAQMSAFQVEVPEKHSLGDSWGLGWIRYDANGHRLIGHDGSTVGQEAFLRISPDRRGAVVLLTNGGHAGDLFAELGDEVLREEFEVGLPTPFAAPGTALPFPGFGAWEGRYENAALRVDVPDATEQPTITITMLGALAAVTPNPVETYTLTPVGENLYGFSFRGAQKLTPLTFFTVDGASYVHFGGRALPRAQ